MIIIHYHNTTGEIKSWGSSSTPPEDRSNSHLTECIVLILEYEESSFEEISPQTHKIINHTLVHKTKSEIADAFIPTLFEVKAAILEELILTDNYINPPTDRPITGPFKFDWKPYRKTLRDLSKLKTSLAMIEAWPKRPNKDDDTIPIDGDDAIPRLREAVAQSMILKSL